MIFLYDFNLCVELPEGSVTPKYVTAI